MAKRKIKICICCQVSPVKNQNRKDCLYCKNCGRYICSYNANIYLKLKRKIIKELKK